MAIDRLLEAECLDPRSGLYRRSAGEWQALRYLKAKQVEDELVKLAEDDLREAECFHAATSIWGTDYWRPEAYDADLFYFLAILYVSRCDNLHDIEALSASASVSIAEIRRLVCFAQVILRSVITVPRATPPTGAKWENEPPEVASSWDAFLDFKDKDSARAALELGWRSVPSSLVEQLESSSPLLDIVKQLVRSLYFVTLPGRDEGPACATALAFIRNRISQVESQPSSELEELREIERGVVECYRMEAVDLSKEDWDRYFEQSLSIYGCDPAEYPRPLAWGPLTVGQVKLLLSACSNEGSLAASLFTRKPPKSVFLSHLLALYDSTVHARLWLLKVQLPVYVNFEFLHYRDLGHMELIETEALKSEVGFQERVPSYVERLLKREGVLETAEYMRLPEKGCVYPVSNPICSRLKVPLFIKKIDETDEYHTSPHALGTCFSSTLWYETKHKLAYWLRVGEAGGNDEAAQEYGNTEKFLKWSGESEGDTMEPQLKFLA